MNNLQALVIVRNAALVSNTMRTRQGVAALKVIDRKIQSLIRKKAWRDCGGDSMPVHMGDPDFKYPIPDDERTAVLRLAEGEIQFWLEHAREGDMTTCAVRAMDVLKQIREILPAKAIDA